MGCVRGRGKNSRVQTKKGNGLDTRDDDRRQRRQIPKQSGKFVAHVCPGPFPGGTPRPLTTTNSPVLVQWQKNGVTLPGVTNPRIPFVVPSPLLPTFREVEILGSMAGHPSRQALPGCPIQQALRSDGHGVSMAAPALSRGSFNDENAEERN
jgi:hypothetical protein